MTEETKIAKRRLNQAFEIVKILAKSEPDKEEIDLKEMMTVLKGTEEFLDEIYSKRKLNELSESVKQVFKKAQENIEQIEKQEVDAT